MRRSNVKMALLVAFLAGAAMLGTAEARPAGSAVVWVGSWASSQQIPEPNNALDPEDLRDATLRQIVHLSIGGSELRVRLSNAFGTGPLHVTAVHIAKPLSRSTGSIDSATDRVLTFSGAADATIPAGADYISDPIAYPVAALSDLAVSIYLETPPEQQTSHPGSRATSFFVHGNHTADVDLLNAKQVDHWFQISGVDVTASPQASAVVTLGDSITDGRGSTTNGNDRWPDNLARRFQASLATRSLGVLNVGTGGNRLLLDGLGPNAVARVDRDVLAQTGVRYLIVYEGINDLGNLTSDHDVTPSEHDALVRHMIAAYEQIVLRARAHGIKVMGATITPYVGFELYHATAVNEADRQTVNAWIRGPGHFDAVVDFDKLVRDPASPDRLLPAYDSGDHIHLSAAAYRAMADAIPLAFFAQNSPHHVKRMKFKRR
jgi:lysophospholipase L1-like esterase